MYNTLQTMLNCIQSSKIAKVLGTFALSNNFEDAKRYKPLFEFIGINIPRSRTVTEEKLISLLGNEILELLVQYQSLYRFFADINSVKHDLNFDFIDGLNSKSLIYARSRIEYNKRCYVLDEQNYPQNGNYYNDFIMATLFPRLTTTNVIFLDNFKNINLLPNKNIVSVWGNTPNKHFDIFNIKNTSSIEEFLPQRNLLLTCF